MEEDPMTDTVAEAVASALRAIHAEAQRSDDDLLHLPEISAMTGVPIETLRWLRSRGEGPPTFRLGRRVVGRRSAVLQWIAEHEQAASGGDAA
jgi:predicted DNA-binding transcriptional regulator AlpA